MKRKIWSVAPLFLSLLCFAGCFGTGQGEAEQKQETIELTEENYTYYLSIGHTMTSSGVYGGGISIFWYDVTVSGAMNGLYRDCKLYYCIGEGERQEVSLNAAGFAQFSYSISSNSGKFSFVGAEGTIVLS